MPIHYNGIQFDKDPDSVIDFAWDWNDSSNPWLESGETISSHTVTAETGLTVDSSSESSGVVTAFFSGGTAGTVYAATCEITTSASRTTQRSINIRVTER